MKILIVVGLLMMSSLTYADEPIELATTIAYEYPNATTDQYSVEKTDAGDILIYWDETLGAQPSEATLQAAWPAVELDKAKRLKIAEIKAEGLSRIQVFLPGIKDFDTLQLIKEMILSIAPASRQLTVNMQTGSDMYQAGSDAVTAINGYTNAEQVENYDPVNDPSWP